VGKQWGTIGKMVRHQWAIAEWDNRGATMGKWWDSSRKMVDNSGKMGRKEAMEKLWGHQWNNRWH